jgi:hypothetical protein
MNEKTSDHERHGLGEDAGRDLRCRARGIGGRRCSAVRQVKEAQEIHAYSPFTAPASRSAVNRTDSLEFCRFGPER